MYQDIGIRVTVLGVAQFKRDINSVNSAVTSLTNQFSRATSFGPGLASTLNNIGNSLVSVGDTLTRSVTLPIITATAALTSFGISFEQAFTGVTKTVGGLSDNFGNLTAEGELMRDMIRGLALEMPIAQTEIAKVTQVAGQLGVTGTQNLIDFAQEAIKLGVATDFSAEEAATSFARLGNIVGINAEDMSKFMSAAGNSVVELGNNFAATEPEIVAVALRLAGAANAIGILTPEILGISTALAALGIPAELGGTAVSRIFLNMQTMMNSFTGNTEDATEQMVAFAHVTGRTVDEFINLIKTDPDQAFLKIIEGLGRMNEEGTLTLDFLKTLDLDTIRTIDVLNRLGPNVDLVRDAIESSNEQWSDQTALQAEYSKFANTTLSKIKLMRNSFYDLGITLFDVVKPGLDTVIGLITDFITTISTKLQTNNKFQKNLILITGSLIALGPALKGVGAALKLIAPLFSTFTFLLANPLLLAGLAAVVAAGIAIKENWFGLGDLFSGIVTAISTLISSLVNFEYGLVSFGDIFSYLIDALKRGDFEAVLFALESAWNLFVIWFENVGLPLLKAAWLKIRPLIESSINQIADAFWTWITDTVIPTVVEKLGDLVDSIGTFIEDNAPLIADQLVKWEDEFWKWVEKVFPIWLDKANGFITDVIGWIGDQAFVISDKLLLWRKSFFGWSDDLWSNAGGTESVKMRLDTLSLQMGYWIGEQAGIILRRLVENWVPSFVNWANNLWAGDSTHIGLWLKLNIFMYDIINWIWKAVPLLESAATSFGKGLINGFIQGITDHKFDLFTAVNSLIDELGLPGWAKAAIGIPLISLIPTNGQSSNQEQSSTTGSVGKSLLSSVATSTVLGSSIISSTSSVNTTNNNNNFSPTINGSWNTVQDIGKTVYDAWISAQAVG